MRRAPLATGLLLCAAACVPQALVRRPASRCGGAPAYEVQPGDTLYRIALRAHTSVEALQQENHLGDPRALSPGQTLCLSGAGAGERPGLSAGEAPPAAGADHRSAAAPASLASSSAAPSGAAPPRPDATAPLLHWPLRGVLYARFGKRGGEPHDGIDLAAPTGTAVHAAGAGKVLFAGEQKGYGLVVIIEHAPGWVTVYAHSQAVQVGEGDTVNSETVVARVGESGHTTGPHLHFELRRQGLPVDPLPYLGAPPKAD